MESTKESGNHAFLKRTGEGPLPETTLDLKDRALAVAAEGITIADARLPGMPLIYANDGFERITGYGVDEVLGRNCRFLQGLDTDPEAAEIIRAALREERNCIVEILNYRKDGTQFWNRLSITPVRDSAGSVTHFIGVQSDVTDRRSAVEALDKANQRMRRDLEAAASIQRSLLPASAPDFPGLDVAWAFRPCTELAGDTFNLLPLGDGRVGLYVLDVSGHGVPAALLSVTLSHNLSPVSGRSWLLGPQHSPDGPMTATTPADVVAKLNEQFQMQPGRVQYFTMVYGIFDPVDRSLRYLSAGHPPMVLVPRTGAARTLPARGMPVGLLEDAWWDELSVDLEPGDRLYLYTDGVVEARCESRGELGTDRLVAVLDSCRAEPLRQSVDATLAQVEDWCSHKEPEDDVTLLALEVTD